VSEPVLAAAAVAFGVLRATTARKKNDEPPHPSERLHSVALLPVLFGMGATALVGLVRVFAPIGVLTFGGGLAMVPAIEHTVVVEEHWLDKKTFADAVALGQITPGPVAICATFIGYRVGGAVGALVATIAMFAPAIAVALAAGHSVERFRKSPLVEGALRALAPAVIGMLAAATVSLGRASVDHVLGAIIARFRTSPLFALLGGGAVHVVFTLVRG
jgi:chromate transporter